MGGLPIPLVVFGLFGLTFFAMIGAIATCYAVYVYGPYWWFWRLNQVKEISFIRAGVYEITDVDGRKYVRHFDKDTRMQFKLTKTLPPRQKADNQIDQKNDPDNSGNGDEPTVYLGVPA